MNCPVNYIAAVIAGNNANHPIDCDMSSCAWWIPEYRCCAIKLLAVASAGKNMPEFKTEQEANNAHS